MINLLNGFSQHFYFMVRWNIFIDGSFAPEEVLVYKIWVVMAFKFKYCFLFTDESGLSSVHETAVVACNIKCVSCGFFFVALKRSTLSKLVVITGFKNSV